MISVVADLEVHLLLRLMLLYRTKAEKSTEVPFQLRYSEGCFALAEVILHLTMSQINRQIQYLLRQISFN